MSQFDARQFFARRTRRHGRYVVWADPYTPGIYDAAEWDRAGAKTTVSQFRDV